MAPSLPKIDARTYQDIVEQTEKLASGYSGWQPPGRLAVAAGPSALIGLILDEDITDSKQELVASGGMRIDADLAQRIAAIKGSEPVWVARTPMLATDPGEALLQVFARMAGLVIDRLNRAPEKNFLAFLDLIGARIHPPQPARAPLTFTPAAGSPAAVVPAHTRVAALPTEGESEPVLFETERELTLTPAMLAVAFVRQPAADTSADVTGKATGAAEGAFPAFAADQPIEHSLYLACEEIFTLPGPKTVTVDIESPDRSRLQELKLAWSYWDGEHWEPLGVEGIALTLANPPVPEPLEIAMTPENPAVPEPPELDRRTGRWLRAQVQGPLSPPDPPAKTPSIQKISIAVKSSEARLLPDQGFANTTQLDLGSDVLPFGERPRAGDTLYLLSQELFSRGGATVTLYVTISPASTANQAGEPDIDWQMWDGSDWQSLDEKLIEKNTTEQLTANGELTFAVPSWVRTRSVNGVPGYWLRARLAAGNYGTEPHYEMLRDAQGTPKQEDGKVLYQFEQGGFAPPVIQSLRLGCTYNDSRPPGACLARNDFRVDDLTSAAGAGDQFWPFKPCADARPTLYLGFDRPFDNRPAALYVQLDPALYSDQPAPAAPEPPGLTWEYSAGERGWAELEVHDETRAFTERGLVSFIGPRDWAAHADFGQRRYWLRVRWDKGSFVTLPRLRRMLTNTTWASQATTIDGEVLGSSDASPSQVFRTTQAPVLPGQLIEVREREPSPPATVPNNGQEAIAPDASGGLGAWVHWSEVRDFYGSSPRDRHYVLDRLAGEVRFGDGQHGMLPPQGRGNIRAALYRTGGGARGNRPAHSIVQLKSAVPYVAGVTNHEPAGGGADREQLEDVEERGPRFLRHRDRAVTPQDFEDLARETSPEVALARAISASPDGHDAGSVTLILVPRADDPQPIPSLELIDRVESYIRERCDPTIELQAAGPDWVQISVTAEIVPASIESADSVCAAVGAALRRFLHPLSGGADRRGWQFGRKPQPSDIYAQVAAVAGVDHVRSLSITEPESRNVRPDRFLIYSGEHNIHPAAEKGEG